VHNLHTYGYRPTNCNQLPATLFPLNSWEVKPRSLWRYCVTINIIIIIIMDISHRLGFSQTHRFGVNVSVNGYKSWKGSYSAGPLRTIYSRSLDQGLRKTKTMDNVHVYSGKFFEHSMKIHCHSENTTDAFAFCYWHWIDIDIWHLIFFKSVSYSLHDSLVLCQLLYIFTFILTFFFTFSISI
jgi:hypothetical protein